MHYDTKSSLPINRFLLWGVLVPLASVVFLCFFLLPFWVHAQLCVWLGGFWGSMGMALLTFITNPRLAFFSLWHVCGGIVLFGLVLWAISLLTVPLFHPILF